MAASEGAGGWGGGPGTPRQGTGPPPLLAWPPTMACPPHWPPPSECCPHLTLRLRTWAFTVPSTGWYPAWPRPRALGLSIAPSPAGSCRSQDCSHKPSPASLWQPKATGAAGWWTLPKVLSAQLTEWPPRLLCRGWLLRPSWLWAPGWSPLPVGAVSLSLEASRELSVGAGGTRARGGGAKPMGEEQVGTKGVGPTVRTSKAVVRLPRGLGWAVGRRRKQGRGGARGRGLGRTASPRSV